MGQSVQHPCIWISNSIVHRSHFRSIAPLESRNPTCSTDCEFCFSIISNYLGCSSLREQALRSSPSCFQFREPLHHVKASNLQFRIAIHSASLASIETQIWSRSSSLSCSKCQSHEEKLSVRTFLDTFSLAIFTSGRAKQCKAAAVSSRLPLIFRIL